MTREDVVGSQSQCPAWTVGCRLSAAGRSQSLVFISALLVWSCGAALDAAGAARGRRWLGGGSSHSYPNFKAKCPFYPEGLETDSSQSNNTYEEGGDQRKGTLPRDSATYSPGHGAVNLPEV